MKITDNEISYSEDFPMEDRSIKSIILWVIVSTCPNCGERI